MNGRLTRALTQSLSFSRRGTRRGWRNSDVTEEHCILGWFTTNDRRPT